MSREGRFAMRYRRAGRMDEMTAKQTGRSNVQDKEAFVFCPGTIMTEFEQRGENFSSRLRFAGLRPTLLRLSILEIFERQGVPMSCEEVFSTLFRAGASGSISGVRRNIQELTRAGLLRALGTPSRWRSRASFELNPNH